MAEIMHVSLWQRESLQAKQAAAFLVREQWHFTFSWKPKFRRLCQICASTHTPQVLKEQLKHAQSFTTVSAQQPHPPVTQTQWMWTSHFTERVLLLMTLSAARLDLF